MTTTRARHAASARRRLTLKSKVARYVAALVALPLVVTALVTVAQPAGAVATRATAISLPGSGFPQWYADNAGNRVEPCIDAADANCVLPAAEPTYNPALPLSFPKNYPSEFFYAYAQSDLLTTPGCQSSPAGKAFVTTTLEGAFINGAPAAGDQMVFGRIRVKVTSGLCPNTTYKFKHPFGTDEFTTNAAGAVPANIGTRDIGCIPTATVPCDYDLALASPVFGSAAEGFLRWDPAVAPAAPAGYLGDGVTLHPITGGPNGNKFAILDAAGAPLTVGGAPLETTDFTVAGKLAGPLASAGADFGGVEVGATGTSTVTVTNIGTTSVTIGSVATATEFSSVVAGGTTPFGVTGGTCFDSTVAQDATCTVDVTFQPAAPGPVTDTLRLASAGGLRSPLSIDLAGAGITVGAKPVVGAPAELAFGPVRLKTTSSKTVTLTNTGDAPLRVSKVALTNAGTGSGAAHYKLLAETCTTGGRTIAPTGTCDITVMFAPFTAAEHLATLEVSNNSDDGVTKVPVSGTGTGGLAKVSPTIDGDDGFPDWYRDETPVKLAQCVDPTDPYCVVLPDATFDPAQPVVFPTNFPGEFFYTVADSEPITTPGCDGGPEGKAFIRTAIEGTFVNGAPVANEQMVFGRIRITVKGGLCPDTAYTFVHPYGTSTITTNDAGSIPPKLGTEDIGCAPIPPATCDFSEALVSPVLGGVLRWDPAVAPAAPAGYLGDALTFHKVVGAPYLDGAAPANHFKILDANGTALAQTDQFSVMGKYRGPLEVTAGVDKKMHAALAPTPAGADSSPHTLSFANTGLDPIDLSSATITGLDAADFRLSADSCTTSGAAKTLAVDGTCDIDVVFSPTAVGHRTATLTIHHTGINDPVVVTLDGTGGAGDGQAALSFQPRSLSFPQLKVGGTSAVETVNVSNAGGSLPLKVDSATIASPNFAVVDNRCANEEVPAGGSCQIDVVFSPTVAGAISGSLNLVDNTPGKAHSLLLTGSASSLGKAVDAATDANGFPRYYRDENGVRIEPCVDQAAPCVLLKDQFYDPTQPLLFPTNFPAEFFYAVADSDIVTLDGCNGTTTPGTGLMRVALEGTFTDGAPSFGDQITFTRIRFTAKSGLCPNTPYNWVSPYGSFQFTTNAVGGLPRNQGTIDIGCAAVVGTPCVFSDALASPVPAGTPGVPANTPPADLPKTPIDGFLRWDPNVGPAAPDGYLGDAATFHPIVGGTYTPLGASGPVNRFEIRDTADNLVAGTDKFMVAGKVAGPLFTDVSSLAFGHTPAGTQGTLKTVTVRNVGTGPATVDAALGGPNGGEFALDPSGTCAAGPVAVDATCTVVVQFNPTTQGSKTANLRITPTVGGTTLTARAVTVALGGLGDPPLAPAITVTPGVLSFGSVTPPSTPKLTTTVKNTGTGKLKIFSATISGAQAGDYAVTATTCGTLGQTWEIAVGDNCTVEVTFTPKAQAARVASLVLSHNATGGSTTVSLTGTGLGSQFTLSPSPIGFSNVTVNTTKTQTVSVKNSGTINVTLGAATFTGSGAAAYSWSAGTCTGVLLPGKSCNAVVSFKPTAKVSYSATLAVAGDATSLPAQVTVSLSGTGK